MNVPGVDMLYLLLPNGNVVPVGVDDPSGLKVGTTLTLKPNGQEFTLSEDVQTGHPQQSSMPVEAVALAGKSFHARAVEVGPCFECAQSVNNHAPTCNRKLGNAADAAVRNAASR